MWRGLEMSYANEKREYIVSNDAISNNIDAKGRYEMIDSDKQFGNAQSAYVIIAFHM